MGLENITPKTHGRVAKKNLYTIDAAKNGLDGEEGYLMALCYSNQVSLGKALAALKAVIYSLSECGTKAEIWFAKTRTDIPNNFIDRLAYLKTFEVKAVGDICEKCRSKAILYQKNIKNGVQLLCFTCSKLSSPTNKKALAAEALATATLKKRRANRAKLFKEMKGISPETLKARIATRPVQKDAFSPPFLLASKSILCDMATAVASTHG